MNALLKVAFLASLCSGLSGSSVKPAQAFACGTCGSCLGGHDNPLGGGQSEGVHSSCIAVSGCPHPDCIITLQPGEADFERVLVQVEAGDVRAAQTLLRKYPGNIVWNQHRRALQMRAPCFGDGFVGHVPLTDEQNRALSGE